MIVTHQAERLRVVTQNDHAHFAAELLSLWRDDGLARHPRREDLLFATREHDNGWREADAAPRVDPASQRPYDFLTLPTALRHEIWRRGVARYRSERPYAALLIAHHALHLHRDHRRQPEHAEFLEQLDTLQATLVVETGVQTAALAADYSFLELADLASLAVCNRWREPFERRGHQARFDGEALELDPFPLAGATTFRFAYREIPDHPYASDTDLTIELARARWQEASVRLRPRSS